MSCLELDDDDILKVANPMMDDIIRGMCDQHEAAWGSPGQRALVAIFRKQKSFTLVWDQQYSGTNGQVMAVMTVALKGGRYFVDYLLLH